MNIEALTEPKLYEGDWKGGHAVHLTGRRRGIVESLITEGRKVLFRDVLLSFDEEAIHVFPKGYRLVFKHGAIGKVDRQ